MAARYHNSIAEICEGELVDFELVSTVCSERSGWRNVMCGVVVWHVSRPAVIGTWWNVPCILGMCAFYRLRCAIWECLD